MFQLAHVALLHIMSHTNTKLSYLWFMLNLYQPIQIPLSEYKDSQGVPWALDQIYINKFQVCRAKMSWLHQRNFSITLLKSVGLLWFIRVWEKNLTTSGLHWNTVCFSFYSSPKDFGFILFFFKKMIFFFLSAVAATCSPDGFSEVRYAI